MGYDHLWQRLFALSGAYRVRFGEVFRRCGPGEDDFSRPYAACRADRDQESRADDRQWHSDQRRRVKPAASPGLYVLSAVSPPPTGAEITHFPLSGDTTGALATYQWTYSRSNRSTATVGIDAFNTKLRFSYESMLTEQTSLTFELRGGHDYTMLAAAEGDGVLWVRPMPSARPGSDED